MAMATHVTTTGAMTQRNRLTVPPLFAGPPKAPTV
jgi:hypothetical protein